VHVVVKCVIGLLLWSNVICLIISKCLEECDNSTTSGWSSLLQTSLVNRTLVVSWEPNMIDDHYIVQYRVNGTINYTTSYPVSVGVCVCVCSECVCVCVLVCVVWMIGYGPLLP